MCGILVFHKNSDPGYIKVIMDQLDKDRGGDGMGIALFNTPNVKIIKDMRMKTSDCIDVWNTYKEKLVTSHLLFHTRKASQGYLENYNLQPFATGRNSAVCNNGTWTNGNDWAKVLVGQGAMNIKNYNRFSDTKIAAMWIRRVGWGFLDKVATGVFIKFMKNHIKLLNYGYRNFEAVKYKDIWYYASAFPERMKEHFEFEDKTSAMLGAKGFRVLGGEVKEKKTPCSTYSGLGNYRSYTHRTTAAIPKGGYKKLWKDHAWIFNEEEECILHFNPHTGEEYPDTDVMDEVPKEVKKQKNQLSKKDKKLAKVAQAKLDRKTEEELKKEAITWEYWDGELDNQQMNTYRELTVNLQCPIAKDGTTLEDSVSELAQAIKGKLILFIKKDKGVEFCTKWFVDWYGYNCTPVKWLSIEQILENAEE